MERGPWSPQVEGAAHNPPLASTLMRLALIFPTVLLVLHTRSALAQDTVSIDSPVMVVLWGARVRAIEGTLTNITDDSIFIARPRQRDVSLARGAVKKLYVSQEEGDMGAAGAVVGLDAGVLVGGVGGALLAGPRAFGRVVGALVGAVAGGMIGLTQGAEIGSRHRSQRWVEVPWPSTPTALSAPR